MSMRKYGASSFKRPMTEEKEMKVVKRYDIASDGFGNFRIDEDRVGRYVTLEDYAALKAERDALAANVSDGLGQLAGAMLNRTLDSGSKQAVAYAECADMVAKFAANLRKENSND